MHLKKLVIKRSMISQLKEELRKKHAELLRIEDDNKALNIQNSNLAQRITSYHTSYVEQQTQIRC